MADLKTVHLSRIVVTLPVYDETEDASAFTHKVASVFQKANQITHHDFNKLLKLILWEETYPYFVKHTISRKYRPNEIVDAWRYETANRDDLCWITTYVRLNTRFVKHAAKNPNFDSKCFQNLFAKFEHKEEARAERRKQAKRLVQSLNTEVFTDDFMLWLLQNGKQYGFQEEARNRILAILGLDESVPSSWIAEILKKEDVDAKK